ncbi:MULTISPECIES: acetylornithine/succinylornithine family transaminase [Atopobiaceae]|uniref:Acetylornithine aminotransferase n=1 Tax=Parafannyhessea umbonata TaxID=604330 RepID=A0A1H6HYK7_9ACTN|nr:MULTISPECIES: acetylornithine/succinylornithine family transaminase [Atopobiaceae]SEH39266.1 acetylornithine aminotransferase [Parafannyhessea umbonata]SJZ42915.1 acetylornithine aminotransferase [Olsenella sp. KH1P3]
MDQRNAAGAGSFETAKALDDTYVMNTYGRLPVEFVRGSGAELADSAGKTYLDFLGGIGAASLGHANPVVARAVKDQLDRVWQVGNYFYVENRGELAQALSELLSTTTDEVGHPTGSTGSTWKTFFSNSGAESNEGAIKVARRWGERKLDGAATIVTARKSFHGRTLATLAATGQDVFHKSFRPLPEGFCSVPLNDLASLDQALGSTSACAVMLECVQGEGGVWPADPDYLRGVRELCDGHDVLLVIDEVQTGFFRCGAPFSYQLAGIEPDVVSMAKGIGGGFPMGAVAAREKCADLLAPGDHGSTFGGNALAAAAGRATLQQMAELDIGEHVIEVGAHLAERLAKLTHVSEVRGHGLMRGAQLDVPIATPIVERGLERGLVLNHIGDSILRFLPPLVITSEQVDAAMDELERLIGQMA